MAARAAHVLGLNSDGDVVKPARGLYPHQWSWDTAFIAIGLSALDVDLAQRNLDALFTGQWRNGMVPHIVFDPDAKGYFPGPDRWASAEVSADAPATPLTSGICQPPVHAIAALHTVRAAARRDASTASAAIRWAETFLPKLLSWHRFLATERTEPSTGLVRIFHGWESGMDNSPRFDGPYSRVWPGPSLPPYERRDLKYVVDAGERPTNQEYDRYLWLVEEAKQAGYDQQVLNRSSSFNVGDVFFTALFAAANDDLAELAALVGAPEVAEARGYAEHAPAPRLLPGRARPAWPATSTYGRVKISRPALLPVSPPSSPADWSHTNWTGWSGCCKVPAGPVTPGSSGRSRRARARARLISFHVRIGAGPSGR